MKKIGILGGTFNPIHNGHLQMAEAAYEQFDLDHVIILPNHLPKYKDTSELISAEHRKNMVSLAIKGRSEFILSTMELEREGPTFSYDTMKILKETDPDSEYFFILGGDSLAYFDKWHRAKELLSMIHIICAPRKGFSTEEMEDHRKKLRHMEPKCRIEWLDFMPMDISSSEIRDHIRRGDTEACIPWVPQPVLTYIIEHHLYKGE